MDPSEFAGMSWDMWPTHVETEKKDLDIPNDRFKSGFNKLPKEYMKIFGTSVDSESLELTICEECNMNIKPQALLEHYDKRHNGFFLEGVCVKESSPMVVESEDISESSSSIKPIFETTLVNDNDNENMDDVVVVEENIKNKNELASPSFNGTKHKTLKTRTPFTQMCSNKWHDKKKNSKGRNKCAKGLAAQKNCSLSQEQDMENNSECSLETAEGMNVLLNQLPEMTLNIEKQDAGTVSCTSQNNVSGTISLLSYYPRPLSRAPWFSCSKVGGLLYSSRHTQMERKIIAESISEKEENLSTKSLRKLKKRKRNSYKMKK